MPRFYDFTITYINKCIYSLTLYVKYKKSISKKKKFITKQQNMYITTEKQLGLFLTEQSYFKGKTK